MPPNPSGLTRYLEALNGGNEHLTQGLGLLQQCKLAGSS